MSQQSNKCYRHETYHTIEPILCLTSYYLKTVKLLKIWVEPTVLYFSFGLLNGLKSVVIIFAEAMPLVFPFGRIRVACFFHLLITHPKHHRATKITLYGIVFTKKADLTSAFNQPLNIYKPKSLTPQLFYPA